jgi:2-octaprenyl-6-methoxyphenol hydroxylase
MMKTASVTEHVIDTSPSVTQFDVVIVGGGMVGASLSLLLKPYIQKGLSVALVDAQAISENNLTDLNLQQPSFDERTTAISLGSKRILHQLGVWDGMASAATAIEHIQVSRQQQFGRVRLHANESNVEALGYVVENKHIGCALQKGMLRQKTLTILAPFSVKHYAMTKVGVQLEIESGESETPDTQHFQCKLLVLADGTSSEGCRQLGISQTRYDYQQHAIVCNVSFDQDHRQWAYERFTQAGPLALLPMSQNRYALVWCMDNESAEKRMALSAMDFQTELQKMVSFDKGRIIKIGQRSSYPLALVQANEQVRQHVVVLGNAAHALHPVAGQGFNLALRDAKVLAESIGSQLLDVGNLSGLQQYLNRQTQDQARTTFISHVLPPQFSEAGLHWSILRALSMTAMDVLPTSKQLFANQAMGLVGNAKPWRP